MKTLKKIHLKSVSEVLSDKEMKQFYGGGYADGSLTDQSGVNNQAAKPCPAPKRPCDGPNGKRLSSGGICCLGPYGPWGILGTYCYAELQGLSSCPS